MKALFVAALLASAALAAPFPEIPSALLAEVTPETISAHMRFIGNSMFEGRIPGSFGETVAAEYIRAQLSEVGIAPGGDGGFFQYMPLEHVTPVTTSDMTFTSGATTITMKWFDDYVGSTQTNEPRVSLDGEEMVFVGYGITDADKGWDDYKGINVTGKVAVVLVSQPTTGIWKGLPLSYSARSGYKYTEAARRGAKAAILVHTLQTASYPWGVVQNSNSGTRSQDPDQVPATPLTFTGWITSEKADAVAQLCGGLSLQEWFVRAEGKDFQPISLCTRVTMSATYERKAVNGTNVIGIVRGSKSYKEAVVLSAHIDHIGVRPTDGAVLPGTLDNGSGAAIILSLAVAFARSKVVPSRTVVFLFPTGEECGLYGAAYFVRKQPAALTGVKFLADINFDIANAWGPAKDVGIIGRDLSNLGNEVMPWAAAAENMIASPDPTPLAAGFLYRGDQYSFIKAGIPGIWVFTGGKFLNQPDDYFQKKVWEGYFYNCYHRPCDSWSESIDVRGMVQHAKVGVRAAYAIAASDYVPKMY